jgi:hypothetical protein
MGYSFLLRKITDLQHSIPSVKVAYLSGELFNLEPQEWFLPSTAFLRTWLE